MSIPPGGEGGEAVFTVSLSAVTTPAPSPSPSPGSDNAVSFSFATQEGTAGDELHYRPASGTGFINAGEYQTQIRVLILPATDPIFSGTPPRTFFVNLSNAVGATIVDPQGVCTINVFTPPQCLLFPDAYECLPNRERVPPPASICPIWSFTHSAGTVDLSRQFRDEVMAKTPHGQKYTQDYYQYAGEVVRLMIFNPRLIGRMSQLLERYQPVMRALVNREKATANQALRTEMTISQSDLDEVDDLLSSIAAESSQQLRQFLEGVRRDMRDPQVHKEFGVSVVSGESDASRLIKEMGGGGSERSALEGSTRGTAGWLRQAVGDLFASARSGLSSLWNSNLPSAPVAERAAPPVQAASSTDSITAISPSEAYGNLPLTFEVNQGQADHAVNFLSRGDGYTLFLTPTESVMALRRPKSQVSTACVSGRVCDDDKTRPLTQAVLTSPVVGRGTSDVLRMKFIGANPAPPVAGLGEVPTRSNYFIGNDPKRWRTDVPNYSRVQYEGVYPGIDLVYYGNQRQLEYDFTVAPGADPKAIALGFAGADKMEVDAGGDLVLHTTGGDEVRMLKPVTYQEIDGVRHEIASRYVLREDQKLKTEAQNSLITHHSSRITQLVGFQVEAYDTSRPLVIDPVLIYSTYLGGGGEDKGSTITVDSAGNAYVIGFTDSTNFPVANARQSTFGGQPQDVFVAKLNASGNALVYSTYLGGNGQDHGSGIAVDASGNAYITGYTGSNNFPVANALQPTRTGAFNAFVAKLDPTGSTLIYSTHLGGNIGEFGSGIAVDSAGNAYVTGVTTSRNFPTMNPFQPAHGGGIADAFVTKLNPAGTQLVFSTYLGGSVVDGATGIALDAAGNIHVTGVTSSTNFPTANPIRATFGGGDLDAFVTKLNAAGTQLIYSTYLGGNQSDRGFRIATDSAGNAYVAGDTASSNFPVSRPVQDYYGGGDAFVAKLNPAGALSYGTYLGGTGFDGATAIAVDAAGRAYVTGYTESFNFPTTNPLAGSSGGGTNAFVTKLNAAGTALDYSTYLGGTGGDAGFGIAVDSSGSAYVLGQTNSTNFPTVNPLQPAIGGASFDVFIAKLADTTPPPTPTPTPTPTPSPTPNPSPSPTPSPSPSPTPTPTPTPTPNAVQFSASNYNVQEDCTLVTITVNRIGDTSGTASIEYRTSDLAATERKDYITALGKLEFAAGETSKTFVVLINEDSFVEGNEIFNVNLSNPSGASLGVPVTSTVTIADDTSEPATNVIDDPRTYVCQNYHDFLNRQPDESGWDFWTNQITSCGADQACIEVRRINVSASFFLSIEFQQTGYLVERAYKTSYGDATGTSTFGGAHTLPVPTVRFLEFLSDTQQITKGVIVLQSGWEQLLEANKQAFFLEFVQRARFTTAFLTTMTPAEFVDQLNQRAGNVLSAGERTTAINLFGGAGNTTNNTARAQALRQVAEDQDLQTAEFNRAFVLMQYLGYLRRNPNDPQDTDYTGYDFWLTKLNQFNGNFINAEMVKAFITSIEYRQRFAP